MFPALSKWAGDLPPRKRMPNVLRNGSRAAVSRCPGLSIWHMGRFGFSKRLAILRPDILRGGGLLKLPALRVAAARSRRGSVRSQLSCEARKEPVLIAGGGVPSSSEGVGQSSPRSPKPLNIPGRDYDGSKGSNCRFAPTFLLVLAAGTRARSPTTLFAAADFCLAVGSEAEFDGTALQYPRKGNARPLRSRTRIQHRPGVSAKELSIVADSGAALTMLREAAVAARVERQPMADGQTM